jgi:hypothetical protein
MLAACSAPAYIGSGVLMPVKALWTPPAFTEANLEAALKGVWTQARRTPLTWEQLIALKAAELKADIEADLMKQFVSTYPLDKRSSSAYPMRHRG